MRNATNCQFCGADSLVVWGNSEKWKCETVKDYSSAYEIRSEDCYEKQIEALKSRLGRMSETANYILDRLLQTAPQDVFEDCQERWNKATGDQ